MDEFERWAEQATVGLPLPIVSRTKAELREHYEAAVQAAMSRGETPEAAHLIALGELGAPELTARALQRSHRPPLTWRSIQTQTWLVFLLIALALASFLGVMLRDAGDMGHPTFEALVLQTSLLSLVLAIPLSFGALDLSMGAAVMIGVLIARPPTWDGPVELATSLLLAGVAGLGLGLLNGLLAMLLRRPVALISALTGLSLLYLAPLISTRPYSGFALNSSERISLLQPTLWLVGAGVLLTLVPRWLDARTGATAQLRHTDARSTRRLAIARLLGLCLSSCFGAIVGVFMVAQGIRDNTYEPLASFLIVVPLAGLLIGGQYVLIGWRRPIGAIAGALATAAICLHSTQPSDNLAPGAILALLLCLAAGIVWRKAHIFDTRPVADATSVDSEYMLDRA